MMWSVQGQLNLLQPFLDLLFEVCHVVLGLRPQCRHLEYNIGMPYALPRGLNKSCIQINHFRSFSFSSFCSEGMVGARSESRLQSRPILVPRDHRLVAKVAAPHAVADNGIVFVLQNGRELLHRSTSEQWQRQWCEQSRRSRGVRRKLHIEFHGIDGRFTVRRRFVQLGIGQQRHFVQWTQRIHAARPNRQLEFD